MTVRRGYEPPRWGSVSNLVGPVYLGTGDMLSPRFLRMQAEKCLRSALATTDLDIAADLRKMARDLESWANEADIDIQPEGKRPLIVSSTLLH